VALPLCCSTILRSHTKIDQPIAVQQHNTKTRLALTTSYISSHQALSPNQKHQQTTHRTQSTERLHNPARQPQTRDLLISAAIHLTTTHSLGKLNTLYNHIHSIFSSILTSPLQVNQLFNPTNRQHVRLRLRIWSHRGLHHRVCPPSRGLHPVRTPDRRLHPLIRLNAFSSNGSI
jgi:hypothetical protein